MKDVDILARNENFRGELPFVKESSKPRRSPEERAVILVKKMEAQRRFDRHIETGGAEVCIGKLPNMFDLSSNDSSYCSLVVVCMRSTFDEVTSFG